MYTIVHRPSSHGESTVASVANKLDRRRVLFTTRPTGRGKIFLASEFGTKCQRTHQLSFFGDTQISLLNRVGYVKKPPCQNQLDPSSRFNTVSACDRRTDGRTHDDSIYRFLHFDRNAVRLNYGIKLKFSKRIRRVLNTRVRYNKNTAATFSFSWISMHPFRILSLQ